MRRASLILALVVAACSGSAGDTTTSTQPETTTTSLTTTTTVATTTTTEALVQCPRAPYAIGSLPARASGNQVPAENIALDAFTSVAGSHSTIWLDSEGGLVIALIRGTLPPEEWPGAKGEVFIDGARAVAGQFDDGSWVVGWFEPPGARCDLYTMVFYPPVTSDEVRTTLESMDRRAG